MTVKTSVIIAPHADDEVIGCGGIMAKIKADGNQSCEVIVCTDHRDMNTYQVSQEEIKKEIAEVEKFTEARFHTLTLRDGRFDLAGSMAISDAIARQMKFMCPIDVYSPYPGDVNQDHIAVAQAMDIVMRSYKFPHVENWYFYHTQSTSEQGLVPFTPNVLVDISSEMDAKVRAFEIYASGQDPSSRATEVMIAQARVWGAMIGVEYAEGYILRRRIIR